jgi:hypothetical protein
MTTTISVPALVRRSLYGGLAVVLVVSLVLEAIKHSTGYWQIAAFAIGPDLTLLFGAGDDLSRGQLHPRGVPAYNLVHRFWGCSALAVLAATSVLPIGYFIGALAWGFHIALDRSLGYGLRTPDGFQRR